MLMLSDIELTLDTMFSQKFIDLPNDRIAGFMYDSGCEAEIEELLDSVESISDLWLLANMKETYDELYCNIEEFPMADGRAGVGVRLLRGSGGRDSACDSHRSG